MGLAILPAPRPTRDATKSGVFRSPKILELAWYYAKKPTQCSLNSKFRIMLHNPFPNLKNKFDYSCDSVVLYRRISDTLLFGKGVYFPKYIHS